MSTESKRYVWGFGWKGISEKAKGISEKAKGISKKAKGISKKA